MTPEAARTRSGFGQGRWQWLGTHFAGIVLDEWVVMPNHVHGIIVRRGMPASDAYVRYHYETDILNFVDSLSRVTRGSAIVRADADGSVTIPFSLRFRNPLRFSMPPPLYIDCVIVPRLHNSFGPVGKYTTSRPDVFTINGGWQHLTVFDLTDDPERWVASLRELHRCIGDTISRVSSRAADPDDEVTLAYVRELIGHLRRDYAGFLELHGQTPLARPTPPAWHSEQERKAWEEQVDAQLARERLWGQYVGMWRRELKALDQCSVIEIGPTGPCAAGSPFLRAAFCAGKETPCDGFG